MATEIYNVNGWEKYKYSVKYVTEFEERGKLGIWTFLLRYIKLAIDEMINKWSNENVRSRKGKSSKKSRLKKIW